MGIKQKDEKQNKIEEIKKLIISMREEKNGELTKEQEFLLEYFALTPEKVKGKNLNFANSKRIRPRNENMSEELQRNRYKELIEFYFTYNH